jgi:hypothetical protein
MIVGAVLTKINKLRLLPVYSFYGVHITEEGVASLGNIDHVLLALSVQVW